MAQIAEPKFELYREALHAGTAWAEALKVGDLFTGARPAAEAAYPENKTAQRLFMNAALDVLGGLRIVTNMSGHLIEDPHPHRVAENDARPMQPAPQPCDAANPRDTFAQAGTCDECGHALAVHTKGGR